MSQLSEDKVSQYVAGDYTGVPKCSVCKENICYIIVDIKDCVSKSEERVIGDSISFLSTGHSYTRERKVTSEISSYSYSRVCQSCIIKHDYITDASVNVFISSGFRKAPLCATCKEAPTFIRIEDGGKYFTKKCSTCMGGKIF